MANTTVDNQVESKLSYEQERGKPMPSENHSIVQTNLILEFSKHKEFRVMSELSLELDGRPLRWVGQTAHNCEESCKGLSGRIKQRILGKLRTENQPRNAPHWPYADRSTDTSGARLIFLSEVRMQAPITIMITIMRSNNANAAALVRNFTGI